MCGGRVTNVEDGRALVVGSREVYFLCVSCFACAYVFGKYMCLS